MNYLRRRILTYIGVFIASLNLTFILPRLAPGSAASILASGSRLAPAQAVLLAARFGLNQPLYIQYLIYLKNVFLTWPPFFGLSFQFFPEPVTYLISVRLGWTFLLIGSSFALATIISYTMVGIASIKRGGKFEIGSLYASISSHAIPVYWSAMILLWVFAVWLRWFPMFGSSAFEATSQLQYLGSVVSHAALPIAAMTISIIGENYLLLRGSTQEVLKSDYVLAAKIRGLSDVTVANRYVLRNSLLPFVSILTFSIAGLISRVVLVEAVFGYPGIGDLIVDAIINRDYPVIQGSLFFVVLIVIIAGILGDLLLIRLDPKLRRA